MDSPEIIRRVKTDGVDMFCVALTLPVKISRQKDFGGIAQLVERVVRNDEARGSNPLTSTNLPFVAARLKQVPPI